MTVEIFMFKIRNNMFRYYELLYHRRVHELQVWTTKWKYRLKSLDWRVCAGVFMLFVAIPFVFYWELMNVLPIIYANNWLALIKNVCICVFLFFNVMGNLLQCKINNICIYDDVNRRKSYSPGWNFCEKCHRRRPSYARHCDRCSTCNQKFRIHCALTSNCIGYGNQRYFIMAFVHLCWGSLYLLCCNWTFAFSPRPTHAPRITICLISCCIFIISGLLYSVLMLCSYFEQSNSKSACTIPAELDELHHSHESICEKLVKTLGKRYYYVWMSPLIQSALPPPPFSPEPILKKKVLNPDEEFYRAVGDYYIKQAQLERADREARVRRNDLLNLPVYVRSNMANFQNFGTVRNSYAYPTPYTRQPMVSHIQGSPQKIWNPTSGYQNYSALSKQATPNRANISPYRQSKRMSYI